jgi:hypothetical protein
MAQAVSHQPFTVEARVQSQASPCGGYVAKKVAQAPVFLPVFSFYPHASIDAPYE